MEKWTWAHPLSALLRFTGYSIDRVVNDPRAAAEVRTLWRIWAASRRIAEQRERELAVAEVLWWRALGCPVPCVLCGKLAPCACGAKEPFVSHLRRSGVRCC